MSKINFNHSTFLKNRLSMSRFYTALTFAVPLLVYFCWSRDSQKAECTRLQFRLTGMNACHPFLTCKDFADIRIGDSVDEGFVKIVHLAEWNTHSIAILRLRDEIYNDDFVHNLEMLKLFSGSSYVVQLVGSCRNLVITEYHPYGSLLNAPDILEKFPSKKNILCRTLCRSYVSVINFLHEAPSGPKVMCDSNSLEKLLSQFLLTRDGRVIVNDLDALPTVDRKGIVCGHTEIDGDFVAPEQLWPFPEKEFIETEMPGYDEKTDIWKIPDVCRWFYSICGKDVEKELLEIFAKCKLSDPILRPHASEILKILYTL